MTLNEDPGPWMGRLLRNAYHHPVGIDAAARHLWSLHRTASRLQRRRRRQRVASMAASVVMVVGGLGAAAGSATALPGDTLYSLKSGIERVELAIAVTEGANARAQLRHARMRLDELEAAAAARSQVVPELAERFLAALAAAEAAADDQLDHDVAALRTSGALVLDEVAMSLDDDAQRELAQVRGEESGDASARQVAETEGRADASGTDRTPAERGAHRSLDDDGDDPPPAEPAGPTEPMAQPPETTIADADADSGSEDDSDPDAVDDSEETSTVDDTVETITIDPETAAAILTGRDDD